MKGFVLFVTILLTVGFLGYGTAVVVKMIQFDQNCGGYLKRAGDANTIETAREQLAIAVNYIERNNLTNGYTSVVYNTPDEDLGFWYKNLFQALSELEDMKADAAPLERSNMLMKLRETLLDSGSDGDEVTIPGGISRFPHNTGYAIFGLLTFILGFVGWFGVFVIYDSCY